MLAQVADASKNLPTLRSSAWRGSVQAAAESLTSIVMWADCRLHAMRILGQNRRRADFAAMAHPGLLATSVTENRSHAQYNKHLPCLNCVSA
jgi:hypothetical protein